MGAGFFIPLYKKGADDGGGNTHSRQQQGKYRACDAVTHSAQRNGRNNGTNIGLKQVCAHTGHIAHIVAHIVGNGGRVPGVILGDTGFHLANQISAHICRLGIDAAAHAGKQSNRGSTKRETGQYVGVAGDQIHEAASQKSKSHHAHAHDSTAGEGNGQSFVHSGVFGGSGSTDIGFGGHIHAAVAGNGGEDSTHQKGHCGNPADAQSHSYKENHHEYNQNPVFGHQKCLSALMDEGGNLLHPLRTGILRRHLAGQINRKEQRNHAQNGRKNSEHIHFFSPFLFYFLFLQISAMDVPYYIITIQI